MPGIFVEGDVKLQELCERFTGIVCINGDCPIALAQEYAVRGMDVVKTCTECWFHTGCEDCAWQGTEYCEKHS